jgi:gas vesicle protein
MPPVALLLVGLLIGGAAGAGAVLASSDPTTSSEYRTVEEKLKVSEAQVAEQRSRADVAQRVAAAATAEARELREALVMGQPSGELRKAAHP